MVRILEVTKMMARSPAARPAATSDSEQATARRRGPVVQGDQDISMYLPPEPAATSNRELSDASSVPFSAPSGRGEPVVTSKSDKSSAGRSEAASKAAEDGGSDAWGGGYV